MRKLQLLFIVALLAMTGNAFAQCTTVTAISGPSPAYVCPPATVTLTDATTGGTWSTGDASTVSVDASTGVVTGITGGPAVVTYTVPGGCSPVYFNINSAAITGPATFCYGPGSSITMSDAYGPGTWSTPSPYLSITSGGGVITDGGPFTGPLTTATISYVPPVSTGCLTVSTVINVDLTPTVLSLSTLPATSTYCEWDASVAFTTLMSGSVGPYTYNWWWYNPGCSCYSTFASNSGVLGTTSTGYRISGFMALTDYGTYYADVVDYYGCVSPLYTGPTLTVNPAPTVYTLSYDIPTVHTPGCQLDLSLTDLGINYSYQIVGGSSLGIVSGTGFGFNFLTTVAGTYYVSATNTTTGCADIMSPELPVCTGCRTTNPALGVSATTNTTVPLTLLPNPNTGNFTLSGSADFMLDAQTVKADIMDITGHLALALDVPVTDGSVSQSIQLPGDMVNGMYFVKLSAGAQSQVLRLLLNR